MSWINFDETLSCKFRGVAIICTRDDIKNNKCETCGWNPLVEADRIKEIKKNAKKT